VEPIGLLARRGAHAPCTLARSGSFVDASPADLGGAILVRVHC
jgi:hypothetical protein